MQLQTHEIMAIIGDQCVKMMMWTDAVSEGGDESVKKGAKEMKDIINAYTGLICRAIQKAEDERVENMLKDMEASE